MLLIAVFPFDILAAAVFGSASSALRIAIRDKTLEMLRAMVEPEHADHAFFEAVPAHIEERFQEYASMLRSDSSPAGIERFSFHASKNIVGYRDAMLGAQIALHFSLTMKHMTESLKQYELS